MLFYDKGQGHIVTITGPMHSEKSGELIDICHKSQMYGRLKYVTFKPSADTRWNAEKGLNEGETLITAPYANIGWGEGEVKSRIGTKIPAITIPKTIDIIQCEAILTYVAPYHIVAFDEAQFFEGNIVPLINELANRKKFVVVDGLNMTYKGTEFGLMGNILSISDEVIKKFAYCDCCGSPKAVFTQMLVDGVPAQDDIPELTIEGNDSNIRYESRCRNCYIPPKSQNVFAKTEK